MKLSKEECIAIFTMIENVSIPGKQASFVSCIFNKLDKEIVRLDSLEKKSKG